MTLRRLPLALLLAGTLAACDSSDDTNTATATVSLPAGVTAGGISGAVDFTQDGDDLSMRFVLTGATPGEHGSHIQEVGSCAPADLPDRTPTRIRPARRGATTTRSPR